MDVLHLNHGGRDIGGDIRVAVAVATTQVPNRSGASLASTVIPSRAHLMDELVVDLGDGVGVELLEGVDRRSRLFVWGGPLGAQLVGLPHQIDQLGEATIDACHIDWDDPSSVTAPR